MKNPLPNDFFHWLFECTANSQCRSSNYGKAHVYSEYGISIADYLEQNYNEAMQDARHSFATTTQQGKAKLVEEWQLQCAMRAAGFKKLAETEYDYE